MTLGTREAELKRLGILLFLFVLVLLFNTRVARSETLYPGDTLEIQFSVPSDLTCPDSTFTGTAPCDVMELALTQDAGSYSPSSLTAQLFDGPTLLGTDMVDTCCIADFVSSTSLFSARNPPVVDFTGIGDGTIDGIIDLSIADGWVNFSESDAVPQFFVGHAVDLGAIVTNSFSNVNITSVTLISPVPEPVTIWWIGVVVCLAGLIRRWLPKMPIER
jgi:hypothetical protein